MGKGDKKSRRGKISNGSYGARRPRSVKKRPTIIEKISVEKKK
ncbi:MAG: 30S ribosomal protein THX [Flavobacteriaceae bacterium]